tara:strand:- start:12817 stop:14301 length:1485 start_codon:yes stop_codon:yes gene_type:complete
MASNPGRVAAVGVWLGPALALIAYLALAGAAMDEPARRLAAVTVLMAVWWITEAIPLAATALVPLVLFHPLDISPIRAAAAPYADPVIFLFMGGLMLGKTLERWGAHKRLALHVILRVGVGPKRIVAGVMIAAAIISAFVSNTATAVMMLPIVVTIATLAGGEGPEGDPSSPKTQRFAASLLIGLAWACSIGGLATVTGSPPNGILVGFLGERGVKLTWGGWLMIGLPVTLLLLPTAWLVLVFAARKVKITSIPGGREHVRSLLSDLGRPSRPEKITIGVFALTALAWVLHGPVTTWLNADRPAEDRLAGLHDAAIAIAAAVVLFLLPAGKGSERGQRVLDWDTARQIPWGVLLLFGGGLSLAAGFGETGLDVWLGSQLAGMGSPPAWLAVLGVTGLIVFMTELTSNTATTSTMLPVLAAASDGLGMDAGPLLIAATMSASCAFMLPVATPPNAVIFGSGHVTIRQMARAGLWMNLISIGVITAYVSLLGPWLL